MKKKNITSLVARSLWALAVSFCMITSVVVLSSQSNVVFAAAGWDGCQDSSGNWTSGDPGDKSGCSVRFNGEPVYGLGEYEYYNCSDPSKNATCYYDYGYAN